MKDYPRLTEIVNRFTKKDQKLLINLSQFNPVGLILQIVLGGRKQRCAGKTEWMPDFKVWFKNNHCDMGQIPDALIFHILSCTRIQNLSYFSPDRLHRGN